MRCQIELKAGRHSGVYTYEAGEWPVEVGSVVEVPRPYWSPVSQQGVVVSLDPGDYEGDDMVTITGIVDEDWDDDDPMFLM